MIYSNYDVFRYNVFTAKKFYWVVGHGITLRDTTVVPPNTWVIFLSKPGHVLLADAYTKPMFKDRIIKDTQLTRELALGNIPKEQLDTIRLHISSWKDYIYGPGDKLPNTYITFQPSGPTNTLIPVLGKHDTSKPGDTKLVGVKTAVNRIIENKPGIYFIVACRATVKQIAQVEKMRLAKYFNMRAGGAQRSNIRVTDPSGIINIIRQQNRARIEAQQICRLTQSGYNRACGRLVTQQLLRKRSPSSYERSAKRQRVAPLSYVFAPGLPLTESQKLRMSAQRRNAKKRK